MVGFEGGRWQGCATDSSKDRLLLPKDRTSPKKNGFLVKSLNIAQYENLSRNKTDLFTRRTIFLQPKSVS